MASPRRPSVVPSSSSYTAQLSPSLVRNPLHLKVNRILSTNFEDPGTRQALDILGEYELATGSLGLALRKGGLRKQVEHRIAAGSREFLSVFDHVNDKLLLLQSHLDEMKLCCDEVEQELRQANEGTRHLLEHAEGLRIARATTSEQQALTDLFLARFTLTPQEIRALTSRDVKVGRELFAAMDKTERIRRDCRSLLGGEGEGESMQAGLDIMEYTSQNLTAGYTKIFKWCSFECRGFSKDALEVSSTMKEAVRRLKNRPELLNEILSLLSSTRSSSLLSLFLEALTRGTASGPSGLPRPIELHAHDPIRYVGDMLAWIHQAFAGEREFLESFFGVGGDGRWVGSVRRFDKKVVPDGREREVGMEMDEGDDIRLRRLLDRDLEGCGRPLKIRVQQTIKSQEGSIMAYKIATLIHFYKITMERTIGEEAQMVGVLNEIMEHAYEAFYETLKSQGRSLLRFIQPPAAALSPPPMLLEALATLNELIQVYSNSLLDDAPLPSNPRASYFPSQRELDFKPVVVEGLEPALEMCAKMEEFRSEEWDRMVFRVNCWEATLGILGEEEFLTGKRVELQQGRLAAVERLVELHYENLIKESGLDSILVTLATKDPATPLSHLPTSSPSALHAAIQHFSSFLSTLDTLSSPHLALLPPMYASDIHAAALQRIVVAYGQVWEAVMSESNRYEGRIGMLRRTREEVAMLLGVQE